MNIFLFCIGVVIIFTGGAYLLTVDEIRDIILAIVIMVFGVILSMVSMLNKTEEVYKLTITDTKTKEITYEIVTDIEEYENYLKFTDEDGNVHYILMEDKEILKEELE